MEAVNTKFTKIRDIIKIVKTRVPLLPFVIDLYARNNDRLRSVNM